MNDILASQERGFFLKGHWLFAVLCLVTFLAAITTGHNVFKNAWLIFGYEAIFVVGFLVLSLMQKESEKLFYPKSIGFWLLVGWFISVTLSLINSPYGLMAEWFAVSRYFQTLFHLVFFLCLFNFLSRYQGSLTPLILSVPLSVFVLAFIFIGSWIALDSSQEFGRYFWFRLPPQNAHIRITGFLITTGAALLFPFYIYREKSKLRLGALVAVSWVIWGFMFWCGGRGVMVSVCGAFIVLLVVLIAKKQPVKKFLIIVLVLFVGGVVLAELLKVFPWNGIFQATSRTVAAGGDVYKLATGRPKLWGQVLESLRVTGSWMFGLGSQGYCYMPNRTFAFQPHNLIFQFLAEWGIVGTILFVALLVMGFVRGLKVHIFGVVEKLSLPIMAAGAVIVSLGLHSLVDGIFYHAQSSLYMAIAFAVWMAPRKS